MIHPQPDGSLLVYLTHDFEPVSPAEATLVKQVWPDGRVVFLIPVQKPLAP